MSGGIRTSMKIDGLAETLEALRLLPKDFQEKELQKGVTKGMQPIYVSAKGNARTMAADQATHHSTGLLQRSIMIAKGTKSDTEAAAFVTIKRLSKSAVRAFKRITGLSGRENPNDPFYWKFWEFGTSKLPAKKFLRNAYDTRKEDAVREAAKEMAAGIERTAKRLYKKRF